MTTKQNYDYMKRKLNERNDDRILLMCCGDFYEAIGEDAKVVADVCGIVLTKRDDYYMTGFPHHTLDTYLPKLVRAGHNVAICDSL
jgi:DNA mismatch repair protein MutS